jgi:hypothetical protein
MSVIVAKSTVCCGTSAAVTYDCFPAIAVQRIVPVASTLTIDGVSVIGFKAAQWLVVVSTVDGSRVRSYQIYATHRNGVTAAFGQRAILGDVISHTPNVVLLGGFLNLTVANTDSEDLIVYVTRMAIPVSNTQTNVLDVAQIGSSRSFIASGNTATLDFVTPAEMVAATWLITVTNAAGDRSGSQVFGQIIDSVVATHYGLIGDMLLSYNIIITEVIGLGVELAIENTGLNDYRVNMTRIPVQVGEIVPYCGPTAGIDLWIPIAITIPPGNTVVVDQATLPAHTGVKWLFVATEGTSFRTMAAEINATTPTPTTTNHVLWGIVADFLNLNVTTAVLAGDLVLSVTNNEANPVTINLLRVPAAS